MSAFVNTTAIRVDQKFGSFFVAKLKASDLLKITFSDPLKKKGDRYLGTQRMLRPDRIKDITKYIESDDCAFPNTIILAANFQEDGLICDDETVQWSVEKQKGSSDLYTLTVPSEQKLASIIDGQHRLNGFEEALPEDKNTELVCSVYFDLPNVFQAQLFATINSTQKRVDKSLAYELFGFDLEDNDHTIWSPDKLGIAMCRRLNDDDSSLFFGHVKTAAIVDEVGSTASWQVSTSCVVDGIIRLISSNPHSDKVFLRKSGYKNRKRDSLKKDDRRDASPLRDLYINNEDAALYHVLMNFFGAVDIVYKEAFEQTSALCKTIGIQGLFDVLREYCKQSSPCDIHEIDFRQEAFCKLFEPSQALDFAHDIFMKFSGVGRSRVRDVILVFAGLKNIDDVTNDDLKEWIAKNLAAERS